MGMIRAETRGRGADSQSLAIRPAFAQTGVMRAIKGTLAALILLAALAGCEKGGPATVPSDATGAVGSSCSVDSDCRLFDDYCTGCDCRALAKSEADPKCSGPGVRCLVAPCANKTATCKSGRCALASD
jgi:predicted small lipoprotein YifL